MRFEERKVINPKFKVDSIVWFHSNRVDETTMSMVIFQGKVKKLYIDRSGVTYYIHGIDQPIQDILVFKSLKEAYDKMDKADKHSLFREY